MYILGISGSPRLQGNSEILLDRALAGAQEQGAYVEKIVLAGLKISPCQGCDDCLDTGECIIKDDMSLVYPKLKEADRLILSFPIYFAGLPAQLKALVDRCQALWVEKVKLKIPPRIRWGLWLSVAGRKKANFSPAQATVKAFFSVCGIKLVDKLLVPGIEGYQEILKEQWVLDSAFIKGAKLASLNHYQD